MNKQIVTAVAVIAAGGVANAWINKRPVTTIVIGSYILLLVLSILDMFGGKISQLAGAIAMVAVVMVILTEFIPLLSQAQKLVGGKKA